jgi:hypothetical protein
MIKLNPLAKAEELVCRCGVCRYSDPEIIKHIVDQNSYETLIKCRLFLKTPILFTRGVSCLKHHENIYKRIYNVNWKKYITKDSSHVTDREKGLRKKEDKFYGFDTVPLCNFLKAYAVYNRFRFSGIIWYKRKFFNIQESVDSFMHVDNSLERKTAYLPEPTIYTVY